MGKKSNAKKKQKKKEKVVKVKPTPETPKKKLQLPEINLSKRVIIGALSAIIFTLALTFVGYLIFQRAYRPTPIAKFLPAEKTVAFLELNTNAQHTQVTQALNILENSEDYSLEMLSAYLNQQIAPINFQQDIKPWLHRQIGIAIIKDKQEQLQTVFFLEFQHQQQSKNLRTLLEKTEYSSAIVDPYLIIAKDSALEAILNQDIGGKSSLANSKTYQKVDSNLPITELGFLYLDFKKITQDFIEYIPFLSQQNISIAALNPLLQTLDAEGISFMALEDKFTVQSFLKLDSAVIENAEYLERQENYRADLLDYISADTLGFWGGRNLENQIKRLLEIMSGGSQANMILFDKFIQQNTQKYFGDDINFNQDILPIFKNEFLFAIEAFNNTQSYKFIVELSSPQADSVRLHEIANSFAAMGAIFEPKIVEHTLPDGTISKEIIAVPEEVISSESKYQDHTVHELKMGSQAWGVYYAMIDNIAIFSDQKASLQQSIDLVADPINSIKNSPHFTESISQVMRNADEVSYLNINSIIPQIPLIQSLTSGRNYFNDGIMTLNYVEI